MTTREQLEAEAEELYPLRWQRMFNGEPFPRPEQDAHIRAKTVTAEQVEAAAREYLRQTTSPNPDLCSFHTWGSARRVVTRIFRVAGFRVEESQNEHDHH